MKKKEKSAQITKINWEIQALRLTSFISPTTSTAEFEPEVWWNNVTNNLDHTMRRDKGGQVTFEGDWAEGTVLSMRIDPLRMDWNLGLNKTELPIIIEPNMPPVFKTLGALDENIKVFTEIIQNWLKQRNLPDINRIAFGANLISNIPDRKNGYDAMLSYLPVQLKEEDLSDFRLQVNIHAKSEVLGIKINRLSKWSVLRLDTEMGDIASDQVRRLSPIYANALELDINTDKDHYENLPVEKLFLLIDELIRKGKEISEKGIIAL